MLLVFIFSFPSLIGVELLLPFLQLKLIPTEGIIHLNEGSKKYLAFRGCSRWF
jgi:hypothetical protein